MATKKKTPKTAPHKHLNAPWPAVISVEGQQGSGKSQVLAIIYNELHKRGFGTSLYSDEGHKVYFGLPQQPS